MSRARQRSNRARPDLHFTEAVALGIRQPWAELILRGIKTIEVRSSGTNRRGQVLIYASKSTARSALIDRALRRHRIDFEDLPRGQVVGCVDIVDARPCKRTDAVATCLSSAALAGRTAWLLANPERFAEPLAARGIPYGVWFYPFRDNARGGR